MSRTEDSDAERQLRLVKQAILLSTYPCFEWEEPATRTVRSRCGGLEPREVKRLVVAHVRNRGVVKQKPETAEEWDGKRRFGYLYTVCFEVDGLPELLFVKIVLVNDDPDLPEARLVNAHLSFS